MRKKSKESDIILAIEAIHTNHELSIRRAAEIYGVSLATLSRRIRGRTPRSEIRNSMLKLTSAEEETLVRHIINLDSRGFPPRFDYVRDMANLLLATRHAPP